MRVHMYYDTSSSLDITARDNGEYEVPDELIDKYNDARERLDDIESEIFSARTEVVDGDKP